MNTSGSTVIDVATLAECSVLCEHFQCIKNNLECTVETDKKKYSEIFLSIFRKQNYTREQTQNVLQVHRI